MTAISARVDYFRATTTHLPTIEHMTRGFFSNETTEPSIPLYGYAHSVRENLTGAFYLFGGHTPTMGNCSQWGGTAISALVAAAEQPSYVVLDTIHCEEWKCTRIDLAIDVFDAALKPREFYAALDGRSVTTVFRSWREVANKDKDTGHTVYGGGLESEKQIRIYDKSAEQGGRGDWTRYEMVFSGQRAREVWAIARKLRSDADFLKLCLELLCQLVDFRDWKVWRDTFGVEAAHEWEELPRVESNKWKWLIKQVLPSFREAFDEDRDWRLLEAFVDAVKNS
jgi:hypothetical protein